MSLKLDTACLSARERFGEDAELVFEGGHLFVRSRDWIGVVRGKDHGQCLDRYLDGKVHQRRP